MSAPTRLRTVSVIGAGRVGAVLACALARAGYEISAVTTASATNQARVRRMVPAVPVRAAHDAVVGVDLALLTVPDDALSALAHRIAPVLRAGQVVAHTSGAHGMSVLAEVRSAGAWPVALHPVMTFTGTLSDLDRLPGVAFGVTAPPPVHEVVSRLVSDLGGVVEWVAEDARPLYHAALAHGANHLMTLVNEAVDRLRDAGVSRSETVLAPLLTAALDNALRLGDAGLTGPLVRGDAGTIVGHLAALTRAEPRSVPPYRALARRTVERALAAGQLSAASAESVLSVLGRADQ